MITKIKFTLIVVLFSKLNNSNEVEVTKPLVYFSLLDDLVQANDNVVQPSNVEIALKDDTDTIKKVVKTNAYPSQKDNVFGAWVSDGLESNAIIFRLRRNWVYYYRIKDKTLVNDGRADYYSKTYENFPAKITSVLATNNKQEYYFFNRIKYCKRSLELRDTSNGNCPNGWKLNYDLFGCKNTKNLILKKLCRNILIDGSLILENKIYIMRKNQYWIFDNEPNENSQFGDLVDGALNSTDKWPGFVPNNDGFFILQNRVTMIYKRRWISWESNGKRSPYYPIRENLIEPKPIPRSDDRFAAVFQINNDLFATIVGVEVYYLVFRNKKFVRSGEPVHYLSSKEKFPPNVTAVIKGLDGNYYFFRDDHYCKRPLDGSEADLSPPELCKWEDNRLLFKCDRIDVKKSKAMINFCNEPDVSAAIILKGDYFIFRSDQYWLFDGEMTSDSTPFGNLVDGALFAVNKWRAFDQTKEGVFAINNKVYVYKKEKSYFAPIMKGGILTTEAPKVETRAEVIDKDNLFGTVVVMNDEHGIRLAQIINSMVYYYRMDEIKNEMHIDGTPEEVSQSIFKFPSNPNAVIKEPESNMYFFIRSNKFCQRQLMPKGIPTEKANLVGDPYEETVDGTKRLVNSTFTDRTIAVVKYTDEETECNWFDIQYLFGCELERKTDALIDLCNNPVINGVHILNNRIYVYRNSQLYIFNAQSEKNIVFGRLIEGPIEANTKFKGLDSSNGGIFSIDDKLYIILEKNRFSDWFADGRLDAIDKAIIQKNLEFHKPAVNVRMAIEKEIPADEKKFKEDSAKGFLVKLNDTSFGRIEKNKIVVYVSKNKKWLKIKEIKVKPKDFKFPSEVNAIFSTEDGYIYFFRKYKYCKRKLNDKNECINWTSNYELFGCQSTAKSPQLTSLCDKKTVDGMIVIGKTIYIFRNTKYWIFDGKHSYEKPLGDLIEGDKYVNSKWKDSEITKGTYAIYKKQIYIIYKNEWILVETEGNIGKRGKIYDDIYGMRESDGSESTESFNELIKGAVIKINETTYAKIVKNKYIVYLIKNNKWIKTKPKLVKESEYQFPTDINAVYNSNKEFVYFFKKTKYCKRKNSSRKKCTKWESNEKLFGCSSKSPKIQSLCEKKTIDGIVIVKNSIYIFRESKYWVFDGKETKEKPLGECIEGEKAFNEKWKGIDSSSGSYSVYQKEVVIIIKNEWILLKNDANTETKGQIYEEGSQDSTVIDDSIRGFIIKLNETSYAKIVKNKIIVYVIKNMKWIRTRPKPIEEMEYNFPKNIEAVYQSKENFNYFFRKNEYCKRKSDDNNKCTNWLPNDEFFGCNSGEKTPEMKSFCEKKTIDYMFSVNEQIYIFREKKYWIFKSQQIENKPLGDLVEGDKEVVQKWKDVDMTKGSFIVYKNQIVVLYKHKWSLLKTDGKIVSSGNIYEEVNDHLVTTESVPGVSDEVQTETQAESEISTDSPSDEIEVIDDTIRGAIIKLNETSYAKIVKNKIIVYVFKNKKWMRTRPKPIKETKYNFPTDIDAVYRSKDNFEYYFKKDKYCKRKVKDYNECSEWIPNDEFLGCNSKIKTPELDSLCEKKTIDSIFTLNEKIYVFREKKYWIFDSVQEEGKPLGECIEGNKEVNKKWKGVDVTKSSFAVYKNQIVVIYKHKWSALKTDGKIASSGNVYTEVNNQLVTESISDVSTELQTEAQSETEEIRKNKDSSAVDRESIDVDARGALIKINETSYAKIVKNKIIVYVIKNKKLIRTRPKPVKASIYKYPDNINAVYHSKSENFDYFFRKNKYCKRKTNDFNECKKWYQNDQLFGCKSKDKSTQMQGLCDKKTIDGIIAVKDQIYVFHEKKYWVFDSKKKVGKPLGECIEGNKEVEKKWKGIDVTKGSFSVYKNQIVVIDKHKWTVLKTDGKINSTGNVYEEVNNKLVTTELVEESVVTESIETTVSEETLPISEEIPMTTTEETEETEGISASKTRNPMDIIEDIETTTDTLVVEEVPVPTELSETTELSVETEIVGETKTTVLEEITENIEATSETQVTEEITKKELINEREVLDDTSRSAIIKLNETSFAKVVQNWIIFYVIKNKKWIRTRPKLIKETKYNFPEYTEAVYRSKDNFEYYFKRENYCKRKVKDYNECYKWYPNEELFGCKSKTKSTQLKELCEKKTIDGIITAKKKIYVFSEKKYWVFDSKKKVGKPLGECIEGNKELEKKWKSVDMTKGSFASIKNEIVVLHKHKWTVLKTNGKINSTGTIYEEVNNKLVTIAPDTEEEETQFTDTSRTEAIIETESSSESLIDEKEVIDESSRAAVIKLNETSFAKVKNNKIITYIIKNNKWIRTKPKPIKETKYNFPENIEAVYRSKDNFEYYFRKQKFCKRKVKNYKECNEWIPNEILFGCNSGINPYLDSLCENKTIDSIFEVGKKIYIFREKKYWVFDTKRTEYKPLGECIEGNKDVSKKWKGIDVTKASFAVYTNHIVAIYKHKWSLLQSNGQIVSTGNVYEEINNKLVTTESVPEVSDESQTESESSDENEVMDFFSRGAVIKLNETSYAKVVKNKIIFYVIKNKKWIRTKPKPIKETKYNIPENVGAVYRSKEENNYFFRREEYCKRKVEDYNECINWLPVDDLFGCNSGKKFPELKTLCDKKTIDSMFRVDDKIYIFRDKNYWIFKAQQKVDQLLGEFVEANKVDDKWKGIDLSKGSFVAIKNQIVVLNKHKWSLLKTDGKVVGSGNVYEEIDNKLVTTESGTDVSESSTEDRESVVLTTSTTEGPSSGESISKGAIFKINETAFAKIIKNKVHLFVIKDKKWIRLKPVPIDKSNFKFPLHINAGFNSNDGYVYFFRKYKYCKRKLSENNDCTEWLSNDILFGCKASDASLGLRALCQKKNIDGVVSVNKNVYVFREKKYWIFDGNQTKDKPLGNLIESDAEIEKKWKGLDVKEGNFAAYNNEIVIIYKHKYTILKTNGKINKTGNIYEETETEMHHNLVPDEECDSSGAVVPLNDEKDSKYALIIGKRVFYLIIRDKKVILDGRPTDLTHSKEKFPYASSAIVIDKYVYFFRRKKYCKRLLESNEECLWLDNKDLFSCDKDINEAKQQLCQDVLINSAFVNANKIIIFRKAKYWTFYIKSNDENPFGVMISEESNRDMTEKFFGMDQPTHGSLLTYQRKVYVLHHYKRWSSWFLTGEPDILNQSTINGATGEPVNDETYLPYPKHYAIVNLGFNKYASIRKNHVRYIKKSKYWIPDSKDYDMRFTPHRFPPNITSVLGPTRNEMFIFFRGTQYCIRKLQVEPNFKCEFKNNAEMFGCNKASDTGLNQFCKNPYIEGAITIGREYWLFRGNKYWVFDSINSGPGLMRSGPNPIDKFEGMVSHNDALFGSDGRIVMFLSNQWWSWFPNGRPDQRNMPMIDFSSNPSIEPESYPSSRDKNDFGAVVQISGLLYARLRGDFVYYYIKKSGDSFKWKYESEEVKVGDSKENFPKNILAITKISSNEYLFIQKTSETSNTKVCKRPLISKTKCQWVDIEIIFNCAKPSSTEVLRLCHDTLIDSAVLDSTRKSLIILKKNFHFVISWSERSFDFKNQFTIKYVGKVTSFLKEYIMSPDAMFRIDSGPEEGNLVMFKSHRWSMWKDSQIIVNNATIIEPIIGGEEPVTQELKLPEIKKRVADNKASVIYGFTKKQPKMPPIVYENPALIEFCNDPVFTAADSNLDGSQILIFKKDKYFLMTGLRYGTGKLISSGKAADLLKNYDSSVTAISTFKEGFTRGFVYAFFETDHFMGWTPSPEYKNWAQKQEGKIIPENGFAATLHNRDYSDPMLIALNGEEVHYFKTINETFAKEGDVVNHSETPEKFPANITAAFSMPNGFIYLFRNKEYCVREWLYDGDPPDEYCPKWEDTRIFLGCFGEQNPPYSIVNYKKVDNEALEDLCSDLKISDGDQLINNENTIYVFRDHFYWIIENFPEKPTVTMKGISSELWNGFEPNPDAVMIVKEGPYLRGHLFEFKDNYMSDWKPDFKVLIQKKYWPKPDPEIRFDAFIHNANFADPIAIGFEGKYVNYYKTKESEFRFQKRAKCSESPENWPQDVTAGWALNEDRVYLFRSDKYCVRKWKCSDKQNNCCNVWKDSKSLFKC